MSTQEDSEASSIYEDKGPTFSDQYYQQRLHVVEHKLTRSSLETVSYHNQEDIFSGSAAANVAYNHCVSLEPSMGAPTPAVTPDHHNNKLCSVSKSSHSSLVETCAACSSSSNSSPLFHKGKEKMTWSRLFNLPLNRSKSTCQSTDGPAVSISSASQSSCASHKSSCSSNPVKMKMNRKCPSSIDTVTLNSMEGIYEGNEASKSPMDSMRKKKRSLGMDMREKFAFFRKPIDQSTLVNKSYQNRELDRLLKLNKPSLTQLEQWSTSFDALLSDKNGLMLFHEFLRTEFSDENIEFWIACEDYKHVGTQKKLTSRAHKIFHEYVSVQAKREVNLDSATRTQTELDIQSPDMHTFDQPQKRIQALMEKDSYRRFLRSEAFLNLKKELEQSSSSMGNKSSAPGLYESSVLRGDYSQISSMNSVNVEAHEERGNDFLSTKLIHCADISPVETKSAFLCIHQSLPRSSPPSPSFQKSAPTGHPDCPPDESI